MFNVVCTILGFRNMGYLPVIINSNKIQQQVRKKERKRVGKK